MRNARVVLIEQDSRIRDLEVDFLGREKHIIVESAATQEASLRVIDAIKNNELLANVVVLSDTLGYGTDCTDAAAFVTAATEAGIYPGRMAIIGFSGSGYLYKRGVNVDRELLKPGGIIDIATAINQLPETFVVSLQAAS